MSVLPQDILWNGLMASECPKEIDSIIVASKFWKRTAVYTAVYTVYTAL